MQDRTDVWASRESLASCSTSTPDSSLQHSREGIRTRFIEGQWGARMGARVCAVAGASCELLLITHYTV